MLQLRSTAIALESVVAANIDTAVQYNSLYFVGYIKIDVRRVRNLITTRMHKFEPKG